MMRAQLLAAAALLLLAPCVTADAQQAANASAGASQASSTQPAAPPSAEAMGVSLKSIRNKLKEAPAQPKPPGTGMRYDFYVDVLGKRPAIDFFKDFDLSTKGGVRWGGATHQEILNAMSPYWVTAGRSAAGYDVLAATRKKK